MIYETKDLKRDPMLQRLSMLPPGTEITKEVYQALKTRVHPLPLPDRTRMKSPLGITEGFLHGRLFCWKGTERMYLAFGLSRRNGEKYYYLEKSTMDGTDPNRPDIKKAMRDPRYMIRMLKR